MIVAHCVGSGIIDSGNNINVCLLYLYFHFGSNHNIYFQSHACRISFTFRKVCPDGRTNYEINSHALKQKIANRERVFVCVWGLEQSTNDDRDVHPSSWCYHSEWVLHPQSYQSSFHSVPRHAMHSVHPVQAIDSCCLRCHEFSHAMPSHPIPYSERQHLGRQAWQRRERIRPDRP